MARFTFQTPEGERTVSARDEETARAYVAFLTTHPEPTATGGDGMTPKQARAARSRLDQAAAALTPIRPAR